MAEIGSQWYNPFDPQDPDAVASAALGTNPQQYAAQVATRPASRLAIYRKPVQVQDPQQRVSAGFGAMDVEDRRDYPGSFLYSGSAFDPREAKAMGVPIESGGYWPRDTRAPTVEDYFNPLSQQLGYMSIHGAAERDRLAAQQAEDRRIAEYNARKRREEVK